MRHRDREPATRRQALRRLVALASGIAVGMYPHAAARGQGVPLPRPRKPRVPAGRDPGGIAVAVLGAGVDYLQPDIAGRLARDGEGELIGFDLIDADPWPLEEPTRNLSVPADAGTALCRLVLREATAARLIPVRVPVRPAEAIAQALAFVAQTPARVVLLAVPAGSLAAPVLPGLARLQARALVVVPAGALAVPEAASASLAAVVSVAALTSGAAPPSWQAVTQRTADLHVPIAAEGLASAVPDNHAAARVAALAARLATAEPSLTGPAMKARLLGLAAPATGSGQRVFTDVGRPFQGP